MKKYDNLTFGGWLRARSTRMIALLGSLGVVPFAKWLQGVAESSGTQPVITTWLSEHASVIPPSVTCLVLVLMLFLSLEGPLLSPDPQRARAYKVTQQFHGWWRAQWLVWSIFYLGLAMQAYFRLDPNAAVPTPAAIYGSVALNFLNNMQTGLFLVAYLVLSIETVKQHEDRFDSTLYWMPVLIAVAVASGLELVLRLSGADVYLVSVGAKLFAGFSGAVCMALLIGRVESRFFGLHGGVIAILYFYAALQILAIAFDLPRGAHVPPLLTATEPFVIAIALPLKVLLFLVVYWALHSGRMLFYVEKFRHVMETSEKEWRTFARELRAG